LIPRTRPPLVGALALLAAAACARQDAAPADSALSRDLTLAADAGRPTRADSLPLPNADTAVALRLPAARPVAATPSPAPTPPTPQAAPTPRRVAAEPTSRPAAPPPSPEPVATAPAAVAASHDSAPVPAPMPTPMHGPAPAAVGHTFAAGTAMVLSTTQPICSTTNKAGDKFVATLREPVAAADGGTLPAGTDVVLELSSIIRGPYDHGRVELAARSIAIEGYLRPIVAEVAWVDGVLERKPLKGPPGSRSDASKVGKGAMTGAILGRVFGGKGAKGTVIGAAAGAAAGAAGARSDTQYEGCLPKGAEVKMRLTGPLAI
jgi:hypothetical protein